MKRWILVAILSLAIASASRASAGPISFLTALPVARGQGIIRGQYLLIRSGADSTPPDRNLTVHAVPIAVALGVTPQLAIFGVVPFLDKSLTLTTPIGRMTRGATGLGDAVAFARYTLVAVNRAGSTIRVAPFGGAKLPTGSDAATDRFGRVPPPLQPGSGSWDGLGGVALTWQTLQWEFDAAGAYQKNTTANDFRFGDQATFDLSFQYRVWPRQLGGGVPGFLYAVAESNLVWQDKNELGGLSDSSSGGRRWDVDLGLQYVTRSFVIEGIVQIPTLQRPNGAALELGTRANASIRWSFPLPF